MDRMMLTNKTHQSRQSLSPRYFSRSSGGRVRYDLFQMIPSVFSFGGAAVVDETASMTAMQKSQATMARWLNVLNLPSNWNRKSAPLKMNPAIMVVRAAIPLARL